MGFGKVITTETEYDGRKVKEMRKLLPTLVKDEQMVIALFLELLSKRKTGEAKGNMSFHIYLDDRTTEYKRVEQEWTMKLDK